MAYEQEVQLFGQWVTEGYDDVPPLTCVTWEGRPVPIGDEAAVQCNPLVGWQWLLATPERRCGFKSLAGLFPPILSAIELLGDFYTPTLCGGKDVFFWRNMSLVFCKADSSVCPVMGMMSGVVKDFVNDPNLPIGVRPAVGMPVIIGFGGEQERLPTSVRQFVEDVAPKRIYLPTKPLGTKGLRTAVMDIYATLSVYLVQGGFIRLEDDPALYNFLIAYINNTYRKDYVRQLGASSVLGELLSFRYGTMPHEEGAHPRYYWPDDYRAFRKYVGKTIKWEMAKLHQAERSYVVQDPVTLTDHLMIPAVADLLDIPKSTLYKQSKQSKIHTEEVVREGKRYTTVPQTEIKRLEQGQRLKSLKARHVDIVGSKKKSLQTNIRRWSQQGMGLEAICQKLEDMIAVEMLMEHGMTTKAAKAEIRNRREHGDSFEDVMRAIRAMDEEG